MKKMLFLVLMLLSLPSFSETYKYKVMRVVDGDTVEIEARFLPPPLKPVLKLRVLGVDTPEKGSRAKCDDEATKAKIATTFTKLKVEGAKEIEIQINAWDKYGGRVLGDLIIDGRPLSGLLIASGNARPYDGGKKGSWCNEVR